MFYDKYFSLNNEDAKDFMDEFIKAKLHDGKLFKFIMFNDNSDLNKIKLETLFNKSVWFSYYKYLNDPNEFTVNYKLKKVVSKTGVNPKSIKLMMETMNQVYDVCCFTYEVNDNMWEIYSNKHNGFCMVIDVIDTDRLFPIEYVNKKDIDCTKYIIDAYKENHAKISSFEGKAIRRMAILPYVYKDKKYMDIDFTKEKELRIINSSFDEGDGQLGDRVYPNIKDIKEYRGMQLSLEKCKMNLYGICIGENCSPESKLAIINFCNNYNIKLLTYEQLNAFNKL